MTSAVINQSAVNLYTNLLPSEFDNAVYAMAGKIAMEGCRHGRLCIVHSMYAAALAKAGPEDSDNDTHREWRREELPLAARLVAIAEQAYATL
jgi:hypothetical protein